MYSQPKLISYDRVIRDVLNNQRPNRPTTEGGCSQWMSDELWKLLSHMWSEDPTERPSMQQVHATLLNLRGGGGEGKAYVT